MLKRMIKYLFPGLKLRQKLPLLSLTYSVDSTKPVPAELIPLVDILKGRGCARTDHDALRILIDHRGKSIREIVKLTRRERRLEHPIKKAVRRFWARW